MRALVADVVRPLGTPMSQETRTEPARSWLNGPGSEILGNSLRYLLAIVTVTLVCVATFILDFATPERPRLFLFFGAIVVSAWYGGRGPGWLSVVLSILTVNFFFVPPILVLDFSVKDIPWTLAFVVSAAVTNALSLKRRRMESKLIKARSELEKRVRARTHALRQTNEKLVTESMERTGADRVA